MGAVIRFVFSWEAAAGDDISGFCCGPCPCCGACLIDVFCDRILTRTDAMILAAEPDGHRLAFVMMTVDRIVLHELAHWAGCDEREAWAAEELEG